MTREVEARLKISAVDKTGRVLQQVAGKLQSVNRQAAALNAQQGVVARATATSLAAMARYAAPAAIAAMTVSAVKGFASVERQLTRIGITADASASETQAAFERMQSVSKDMALPIESAISAVDTLVSSGLSLKEAMDFLPAVLATAQASGSATEDIANTAIKASSALKIQAADLQKSFDIMVSGGKAGQFELKDMATYIPELANSFASLGYEGQGGLKTLIALLQTIREDTGSASSAATQAQNIFGKMFSSDTAAKFKGFGIDLRKEMAAAKKNGEDAVSAFVRLSKEAIKGDLSKLPLLFTDQEFRLGMQSLMTSADSYKRFVEAVNSSQVDGTVLRDLTRVTEDAQASIDRMSSSWDKLMNSLGAAASSPATGVMDALSGSLDYATAVNRGLEQTGTASGFVDRSIWGLGSSRAEKDRMAIKGGYVDETLRQKYEQGPQVPKNWKPPEAEFPGGGTGAIPLPGTRPERLTALPPLPAQLQGVPPALQSGPSVASMGQSPLRMPSKDEWQAALKIDATGITQSSDEAARKVADGGREAGKSIEEGAAFIRVAGYDVSTAIANAAQKLADAAMSMNSLGRFAAPPGGAASGGAPPVNADTGRSMPPSTFGPR